MLDQVDHLRSALADRYVLEREVGRGGMATVFLAHDIKHNRPVALKVLHPQLAATIGTVRFLKEIETAASLNNPHILPVYNSGQVDGFLYYVMPFVEGESLRDCLQRERQLPIEDSLRIVRDIAVALDYAHAHGFVHRDIKPANIMLEGDEAIVTDFGIARAVLTAGEDRLTETGLTVGTPAYMSPEQAAGDEELDLRSDVYSLGCVMFEMLAGQPPFSGTSGVAVRAMHMHERVPSVQIVRPDVPPHLQSTIEKALAKTPADRYPSAGEFATSLTDSSQPLSAVSPPRRRTRRWQLAAAGSLAVIAAILLGRGLFTGAPLDESSHVIAPFELRAGPTPLPLTGEECEMYLSLALDLWEDVNAADDFLVEDARSRRGLGTVSPEAWLAIARDIRSGRLISGEIIPLSDSLLIRASLIDVADRKQLAVASVSVLPDVSDVVTKFQELAAKLLGLAAVAEEDAAYRGASVAATRDFIQGWTLLKEGDVAGASEAFEAALEKDPDFADAHFWYAQAKAWSGDSAAAFLHSARSAVRAGDKIGTRARGLSPPLLALAEGRFPQACEEYEQLVAADSADYAAWLGLGECHRRDRAVVADTTSRSGWSFRASYHRAASAYREALKFMPLLTPGVMESLQKVLISDPTGLRSGVAAAPDTGRFLAWPELDDTLAFIPRPWDEARDSNWPVTHREAIDGNRRELLGVVQNWARSYPASFAAQATLANRLEESGELEGSTVDVSALDAARNARRVARSDDDTLAAAVIEISILTKLGRFSDAEVLARSTLGAFTDPEPTQAGYLAPLAALTGRATLTASLMGSAATAGPASPLDPLASVPSPILVARETLLGYAALGAPVDSIEQWAIRIDSLVRIQVEPAEVEAIVCAASDRAMSLAFPVLGRVVEDDACRERFYHLQLQHAFANGDTSRVFETMDEIGALRRDAPPGEVAIDGIYVEAWLLAAAGDTARAITHLDRSLAALPALGMWLMSEPSQTAGLVRAMALRAELAGRSGDRANARRWAEPVIELWSRGAPEVQPLVGRMRELR